MPQQVRQLTDAAVQKAKPEKARREIPDGAGLFLIVQPTGQKSWAVRYRRDGRPRKLTIGPYPTIDLKAARKLAQAALERVAHGADPAAEKVRARQAAATDARDYPSVARLFLDRYLTRKGQRPRPGTLDQIARHLGFAAQGSDWIARGPLAARWRHRKIDAITKRDVLDHLDQLVAKGLGASVNRTRAGLYLFFAWCQRRDLIVNNPVDGIDRPVAETPRARILTDAELAAMWRAANDDRLFGPLYRFLALTGQRRDEARGMRWNEINFDKAEWMIPGARTKNHRDHVVPLTPEVIDLLRSRPRIAGSKGLVFTTTGDTMLGGLSRAKARLDARMLKLLRQGDEAAELEPWVIHDLRRTAASGMQRLGVALPVIEKILNHTSGAFAGIVGVYQRHDYAAEKRAALESWARHVVAACDARSE